MTRAGLGDLKQHVARIEHVGYELRRVAQTRRTFVNWPDLITQMLAEKVGRASGDLVFRTRAGLLMTSPNVPGARLPLYEQFADDCYGLRDFLAPLQGRDLHVMDIGSHIGSFAVNVASMHPRAQVDCFEPSPQSARYLRRNVEQNRLVDRVRVHEVALADAEGTALLDDNDGGSVHNGLVQDEHRLVAGVEDLDRRRTVEVRTTTFDAAVAAAAAPPDLVKMDCEGGEYAMVYASSPASWASVSRVVMEYHAVEGESWDELRAWLAAAGLDVVRHESIAPGLGTAWLARSGDPAAA